MRYLLTEEFLPSSLLMDVSSQIVHGLIYSADAYLAGTVTVEITH